MQTLINNAYAHCLRIAGRNQEIFPLLRLTLPSQLCRSLAAIYAFTRTASELADQPHENPAQRLAKLETFRAEFEQRQDPSSDFQQIFLAVNHSIQRYQLPIVLFEDLISAFRQDIYKKQYTDMEELLDYCRRAANPVGRLVLHLIGEASERNLAWSDNICSALQLINLLQDIALDYEENRCIYLPQQDMRRYKVSETHIRNRINDNCMQNLYQEQVARATALLQDGAALGLVIGGRCGFQLRLMLGAGLQTCKALARNRADCFARPGLHATDWFRMLKYAIMSDTLLKR